jgi:hypothetical protein
MVYKNLTYENCTVTYYEHIHCQHGISDYVTHRSAGISGCGDSRSSRKKCSDLCTIYSLLNMAQDSSATKETATIWF